MDSKTAEKLVRETSRSTGETQAAATTVTTTATAAANENDSLYIDLTLHSSHDATITKQITKSGTSMSFSDLRVGEQTYAYAWIYTLKDGKKIPHYEGTSDTIRISYGSNAITIKLSKITVSGSSSGTGVGANSGTNTTPAASEITYTVHHWQQNITDDNYTEVTADIQTITADNNNLTQAAAKQYTGFTFNNYSIQTDSENGTTQANFYYNRNVHNLTFSGGQVSNAIGLPPETPYRYGATVVLPALTDPSQTAPKTFMNWTDGTTPPYAAGSNFTMGNSDVTLTAQWLGSNSGSANLNFSVNVESSDLMVQQGTEGENNNIATFLAYPPATLGSFTYTWYFDGFEITDDDSSNGYPYYQYNNEVHQTKLFINTTDLQPGVYDISLLLERNYNETIYYSFIGQITVSGN